MGPWEVAGTVAAIVFGAVGAAVAVAKVSWDRRDRRAVADRERAEAEVRAHELERLRREQEEWRRRDAERRASGFRVYSEAEAREFLHQPRAAVDQGWAPPPKGRRGLGYGLVALGVLLTVVVVATIVIWLTGR